MQSIFGAGASAAAIPIWFVTIATYKDVRERLSAAARAFADAAGFEPKPGQYLALPGEGGLSGILFGLENASDARDLFLPGRLPQQLPSGVYRFANDPHDARLAALAFALGAYRFTRYHKSEGRKIKLDLPQSLDREDLERVVEAVTLVRDLVNTPANDMGPADLEEAARTLAAKHGAGARATVGDDLLRENFPLIHAVGRAAARQPRLINLTWGDVDDPRVTLVGKGVCFDSGGLSLKPAGSMMGMKGDMGGAAAVTGAIHALASR
jgi:leucyl aminopeptidase